MHPKQNSHGQGQAQLYKPLSAVTTPSRWSCFFYTAQPFPWRKLPLFQIANTKATPQSPTAGKLPENQVNKRQLPFPRERRSAPPISNCFSIDQPPVALGSDPM